MHHHALLPPGGDLALLFAASLLGSAHCVGMCGPYVAMCSAQFVPAGASPLRRLALRALFNAGRVATYGIIGWVAGAFGQIVLAAADRMGVTGIVAIAAGTAAAVFGLSLLGWIRDPARLAAHLGVARLFRGARTRLSRVPPALSPLLLGMLQGWLPCALVYAAASRACVAGSAAKGVLTMLVFGLGTVPSIFMLSVTPLSFLKRAGTRRPAGALLIALGVLLTLRGLAGFGLLQPNYLW